MLKHMERKRLLGTTAAARFLGVSPWFMRQLAQSKTIPVVRLRCGGRFYFDRKDLSAFIKNRKAVSIQSPEDSGGR